MIYDNRKFIKLAFIFKNIKYLVGWFREGGWFMPTGFTGNFVGQNCRYNCMTLFIIFDSIKRNDAA